MLSASEFLHAKSHPVEKALSESEIIRHLALFEGWSLRDKKIVKTYDFKNFYETISFVNAVAFIANKEDHHPELTVTYNKCTVKFDTHSVNQGQGGISENDFICAAKVDALFS